MPQPTASPMSRRRLRWFFVALGFLSWLSIGCNPSNLSMLLLPWQDNNIEPEYKLFAKDKEITLVILANFPQPPIQPDHVAVEAELPELLAQEFRKRCKDNKHKIKIVPQSEVRNHQVALRSEGAYNPVEVGKKCKADYVLDLRVQSFRLDGTIIADRSFKGTAELAVAMHKVNPTEDEMLPFGKEIGFEYPRMEGITSGTSNRMAFRRLFQGKIARDVTKVFIAYPPEEKHTMD